MAIPRRTVTHGITESVSSTAIPQSKGSARGAERNGTHVIAGSAATWQSPSYRTVFRDYLKNNII